MCLICINIICIIVFNNVNAYTFGETWIVVGHQHVLEWGVMAHLSHAHAFKMSCSSMYGNFVC